MSVDNIPSAAGCDGCVAGRGSERSDATTGVRAFNREGGNGAGFRSGEADAFPDDPSATSFVCN